MVANKRQAILLKGLGQKDFPNPPLPDSHAGSRFRKATSDMGLHPFACASANLSQTYTNTEGVDMGACTMCGFCVRYGCEHYAKASPQVCLLPVIEADDNFELRTGADVTRIHKARRWEDRDRSDVRARWRRAFSASKYGVFVRVRVKQSMDVDVVWHRRSLQPEDQSGSGW